MRPSRGWINDPNGIVYWNGRWHVFFQHNPAAARHDLIHWGHVSSADLLVWQEHPVAFGPDPTGPDRYGCWSGVFVSGLDRPAIAYSGLVDDTLTSTVCLRYGSPDLDTWGSPMIIGRTPHGVGVRVMRDPFVFRYAGRRWALLGAGMADQRPGLLLYSCDDIEDWRFEGVWLTHDDPIAREVAPADIWECPQLVWVDEVPVLILSLQERGVLLHVVALIGTVVEVHGLPSWQSICGVRIDDGPELYAPQLVQDGQNPLLLGWIRQEGMPDGRDVVTGDGIEPDGPGAVAERDAVAGCLSFPRRLRWSGDRLVVSLDPAVQTLRLAPHSVTGPRSGVALPHAAAVTLSGGGGGRWGVLRGDEREIVLTGGVGSQVWVDGEVAEIFPGDESMPTTVRQAGTVTWRLDLEAGALAEIAELGAPNPP